MNPENSNYHQLLFKKALRRRVEEGVKNLDNIPKDNKYGLMMAGMRLSELGKKLDKDITL